MAADVRVPKFIRDPIHDIIRIDDPFILQLLDSAAMQRLRRVRQLGLGQMVYPGAEHSRFTHSLGVYHLASRMMTQIQQATGREVFDADTRRAVLAAALLHDIGHGPFSHVFERFTKELPGDGKRVDHEQWTIRIVDADEEVHDILESAAPGLAKNVREIIEHTYKPHYVTAIVSSQLDVDRFDYLLRDSHMTGVAYGRFDLEWMLRTLALSPVPAVSAGEGAEAATVETIVVDGRRGLSTLEEHMLGRHYMYRHVYFHKTIQAAEQMLVKALLRAPAVVRDGKALLCNDAFRKLAGGETLSEAEYLTLNDIVILGWIEDWQRSAEDKILCDLCRRLVQRKLFKAVSAPPGAKIPDIRKGNQAIEQLVRDRKYDPDYYMIENDVNDIAYKDYFYNLSRGARPGEQEIWFVDRDGGVRPLSGSDSVLIKAGDALEYEEYRLLVPDEVATEARRILKWN